MDEKVEIGDVYDVSLFGASVVIGFEAEGKKNPILLALNEDYRLFAEFEYSLTHYSHKYKKIGHIEAVADVMRSLDKFKG